MLRSALKKSKVSTRKRSTKPVKNDSRDYLSRQKHKSIFKMIRKKQNSKKERIKRNYRTRGKSSTPVDYSNVESVSRSITRSEIKGRLKSSNVKSKRPRKKKKGVSVSKTKTKRKKMKLADTPIVKSIEFSTQKKNKSRMISIKNSKVTSKRRVKKNQKNLIKSEIFILNKSEKFASKPIRTTIKSRSRTPGRKVQKPKKSTLFELKKKRKRSQKLNTKKRVGISKYLKNKIDKSNPRRLRTPSRTKRKVK
jgi:hypothetical protein